jgi:hypothetical protein
LKWKSRVFLQYPPASRRLAAQTKRAACRTAASAYLSETKEKRKASFPVPLAQKLAAAQEMFCGLLIFLQCHLPGRYDSLQRRSSFWKTDRHRQPVFEDTRSSVWKGDRHRQRRLERQHICERNCISRLVSFSNVVQCGGLLSATSPRK